jgi:hypothetical protein
MPVLIPTRLSVVVSSLNGQRPKSRKRVEEHYWKNVTSKMLIFRLTSSLVIQKTKLADKYYLPMLRLRKGQFKLDFDQVNSTLF